MVLSSTNVNQASRSITSEKLKNSSKTAEVKNKHFAYSKTANAPCLFKWNPNPGTVIFFMTLETVLGKLLV